MLTTTARAVLATAALVPCLGFVLHPEARGQTTLHPQTMQKTGEVDSRFLSFNVEAVEVTGGRFWKPYKDARTAATSPAEGEQNQPTGMNDSLFQYRAPIDLSKPKLRNLALALAPSYMRVSGTWRNSTYFQNNDEPALATPPEGYKGVMTRAEWKGVVDFAHAVRADLVTSVATSGGSRNAGGEWIPDNTKAFFEYTRSIGGHIAATEFMNEPTFASVGGAPKGYDATAFGRDLKRFAAFLRKESPDTLLLGPGSIGEGVSLIPGAPAGAFPGFIKTEDMMRATGGIYDAFSYHYYATVSKRCAGKAAATSDVALTTDWLQRNLTVEEFYARLRDQYMPDKPIWLTETGEAGCGGDPWSSEFLDSFRFMDQLGSLAQRGVKTVMVNTPASSDYGLLDEETLDPRPNYWAALLWKRTMGTRVLNPGVDLGLKARIYAQCSVRGKGGVALMILNLDQKEDVAIDAPLPGEQYVLSAGDLLSKTVSLNGTELHASSDGTLPEMKGKRFTKGIFHLAPTSIAFLVFPAANNKRCK